MMRAAVKILAIITATAAFAMATRSALAGSYVVSACSPGTSPGLWTQTNTFPTSYTTGNLCGGPAIGPLDGGNEGGLYAYDTLGSPTNMPNGSYAGWTFTAPPGTAITAITYYRTLAAHANADMAAALVTAEGTVLEQCTIEIPLGSPISCYKPNNQAPAVFGGLSTTRLSFGVMCRYVVAPGGCGAGGTIHRVRAVMYSARVTLSESSAPVLANVGGPLWGPGVVSGVVPVTFAASDATGIKEQVVRGDDGKALISSPQACDFTLAQPCPQQPSGSLSVDTRRVSDGPHTFALVVTDAAGNSQIVTSPPVVVANHAPPVPPVPAAPAAASSNATRTKITAVLGGRRLRVSATIARTGRVRVSWRSKLAGRTLGRGSRVVAIRGNRIAATFTLSRRASRGTTRIAIRSGSRIVAQARARRV